MRFAYSALIVFWVSFLAGAPVKGQDFGPLNISTTPLPSNLSRSMASDGGETKR